MRIRESLRNSFRTRMSFFIFSREIFQVSDEEIFQVSDVESIVCLYLSSININERKENLMNES